MTIKKNEWLVKLVTYILVHTCMLVCGHTHTGTHPFFGWLFEMEGRRDIMVDWLAVLKDVMN